MLIIPLFLLILTGRAFSIDKKEVLKILSERQDLYLDRIEDLKIHQSIEIYDENSKVTSEVLIYRKKDKLRLDIQSEFKGKSTSDSIIYDGKDYYQFSAGLVKKIDRDLLNQRQDRVIFDNWYSFLTNQDSTWDHKKLPGQILIYSRNGEKEKLSMILNARNVWIENLKIINNSNITINYQMSDYTNILGCLMLPRNTVITKDNKIYSKIIVDQITVNHGLEDNLFKIESNTKINVQQIMKELFE